MLVHAVDDRTEDVELVLARRGVADAHRAAPRVAREVVQLALVGQLGPVDGIEDLQALSACRLTVPAHERLEDVAEALGTTAARLLAAASRPITLVI